MKGQLLLFRNIKRARVLVGLSQVDFARKLGVSDKTVSAYETGRAIPPMPTLTKIASITNTPLQEIVGAEHRANNESKLVTKLGQINQRMANLERLLLEVNAKLAKGRTNEG